MAHAPWAKAEDEKPLFEDFGLRTSLEFPTDLPTGLYVPASTECAISASRIIAEPDAPQPQANAGLKADLVLARDLVSTAGAPDFAARFQLRMSLAEDGRLAPGVTGSLLIWQPGADVPRGWTKHPTRSASGGEIQGVSRVLRRDQLVRGEGGGDQTGPATGPWTDLSDALRAARHDYSKPAWILFEDPRFPENSRERFKVISTFNPYQRTCRTSLTYQALRFGSPIATRMALPGNQGSAVLLSSASRATRDASGLINHADSFAVEGGRTLAFELQAASIMGTNPIGSHANPVRLTLDLSGAPSAAPQRFDLEAYRIFPGVETRIEGPLPLAGGTLQPGSQSVSLADIEGFDPRDWTAQNSYLFLVVLRAGGQQVGVALYSQGMGTIPTKGITFPF